MVRTIGFAPEALESLPAPSIGRGERSSNVRFQADPAGVEARGSGGAAVDRDPCNDTPR